MNIFLKNAVMENKIIRKNYDEYMIKNDKLKKS